MRWVLAFAVSLIWLAACTPATPNPHSPGSSPLASPLSVDKGTPAGSDGAMIVFERSGGLAGIHEVWRLYEDGRVVKIERRTNVKEEAQLPRDAVRDAVERMVEAGFLDLADEYMPTNRCCDRFTYRLTIVYEGSVKTVTTMDGAEQPPALAEALSIVHDLLTPILSP